MDLDLDLDLDLALALALDLDLARLCLVLRSQRDSGKADRGGAPRPVMRWPSCDSRSVSTGPTWA